MREELGWAPGSAIEPVSSKLAERQKFVARYASIVMSATPCYTMTITYAIILFFFHVLLRHQSPAPRPSFGGALLAMACLWR